MLHLEKFMQAWPEYADLAGVSKQAVMQHVDEPALLAYFARIAAENQKKRSTSKSKLEERIKRELLALVPLGDATVKWEETGRLEECDGCSHYYYGPRHDVSEEFDTQYDLSVSFSNDDYALSLSVGAYHDCDVGDDKVIFEPHADVHFDQNLTDAYGKEAVQGVLDCIYARMEQTTREILQNEALLPDLS